MRYIAWQVMPLLDFHKEIKGCLEMVNAGKGAFRKTDEDLLMPFCRLAAISILNSSSLQNAQRMRGNQKTPQRRRSMLGAQMEQYIIPGKSE